LVIIPVQRLGNDFSQLETRVVGEIVQKFAQCRLRLAILGDVSQQMAQCSAFRAFVAETNRGDQFWFVTGMTELEKRSDCRD
jgi:hypothetical protein